MRDSAVLVGLTLACAALAACPATLDDRCAAGACVPDGVNGDGGSIDGDANVPDVDVPPDCKEDADANSPEAKPCIVDSFALFVDGASGKDTNDGSKAKPFKSIGAAVKAGPERGKRRVYICGEGPYAEHVKLTTAVNLFGGFACADWAYDGKKAKVAPGDGGYALHVDGVAAPLRLEDIGFEAIAGTQQVPSSIAVFVANAPSVVFKRADLKAAAGFTSLPGDAGTVGTPNVDPKGEDGQPTAGGAAKTCTCSFGGSTTGGKGGDPSGTASGGTKGAPVILPPVPGTATGDGNTRLECEAGTVGAKRGSDAPPAPAQAKPGIGSVSATGWAAGDGAKGTNGGPGQGGGGGGSYTVGAAGQNGGGGGGACGGCGGSGGDGGKGGGASIALLAFVAPVKLIASTIAADAGGNGAAGRDGGPGASGGSRGQGGNDACDGANGGNGAKGGAGAGGAGGVSAAVLYKDGPPINDGSILKHGSKGSFGPGGSSPENDGPDGIAGELVPAP